MEPKSNGVRLLKLKGVLDKSKLCKSAVYVGVKSGTFPAPIKIGERSAAWIESEIDQWIAQRIAESRRLLEVA
jgi:prophage regulatory protein